MGKPLLDELKINIIRLKRHCDRQLILQIRKINKRLVA